MTEVVLYLESMLLYSLPVQVPDDQGCPLCRAGLQKFGYRDVLLLRQFLTPDGYLIGRRYSGVCPKMQRRITKAIRRSRQLGTFVLFAVLFCFIFHVHVCNSKAGFTIHATVDVTYDRNAVARIGFN